MVGAFFFLKVILKQWNAYNEIITIELIFILKPFWKIPAASECKALASWAEQAQGGWLVRASPQNNNSCFLACPTLAILVTKLFSGKGCPSYSCKGRSWSVLALYPEWFVCKICHTFNKGVRSSRYWTLHSCYLVSHRGTPRKHRFLWQSYRNGGKLSLIHGPRPSVGHTWQCTLESTRALLIPPDSSDLFTW